VTARNHHFISQSYLAQFTDTGQVDGKLFAFPVGGGASFHTVPRNVGAERDFNRVDMSGHRPDAIENEFGRFEGQACDAIRRVVASGGWLPACDDDYSLILNLLCLFAIRNPGFRGAFNEARSQYMRNLVQLHLRDRKAWDAYVEHAATQGMPVPEDISFDDIKDYVDGGRYDIEFSPESNLRVEMRVYEQLLEKISLRTWSLLAAPEQGPDFIACDHPVTLRWRDGRSGPAGYGRHGTEVFFPLSPRYVLYGTHEGQADRIALAPEVVASVNGFVARNSLRQVYAKTPEFVVHGDTGLKTMSRHPFADSPDLLRNAAPVFVVLPPRHEPQA
jgi:hypothetical protein